MRVKKENDKMANREQIENLSTDKPLEYPEQDRLGYSNFAENLSNSICKMAPLDGFVISVYGSWGSGKSTLLNFIEYYLKQMKGEQPIIMRFNPWWFSGHEDLTISFFGQLQAELSKGKSIKDLDKLKETIVEFADLVSKIPILDPTIKNVANDVRNYFQKSAPELKEKIAKTLREQPKKILVIVDDIDRLTAEEIKHLFRVIKAVADFPNIVYLLAFDKDIVIKSLDGIQGASGEAYLEKIIQLPFELPLPSKITLCRILPEKLDIILAGTPDDLLDDRYRSNSYLRNICNFIDTPRDIIRLTNTLIVTYPPVKGEVNAVDFISIETLRVFCPIAYDIIRRNPQEFTGGSVNIMGRSHAEEDKAFHNSWINEVQKDRDATKILIEDIFPRLNAVWGGGLFGGSHWESMWRKERRICDRGSFLTYFHLTLPEGIISHTEMKSILALSEDSRAFALKLQELADQKQFGGTNRFREFLWRFGDYTTEDISQNNIPKILDAFFNVGDDILVSEEEGMVGISRIDIQMSRIIRQLLLRFDESRRFDILKGSMSEGKAISTIIHEVLVLGQQHGKYGEEKKESDESAIVSLEHLNVLEDIALEKIRAAASNNSLLKTPTLLSLLYIWQNLSGIEEVKNWAEDVTSNDDGLIIFLESALFIGYVRDLTGALFGGYYRDLTGGFNSKIYRNDPRRIEDYFDLSKIIGRARRLVLNEELTEHQRIALKQFIKEYEMLEHEKDPDSPWDEATWKSE